MPDNSLAGQIEKFNLASVMQNLLQNQATGTLTVEPPDGPRYIYFFEGLVANVRPEGEWQYALGRILLRLGLVEADALERALKAVKPNDTLVNILHRRRKLTLKDAEEALRFLQEEVLYDLFSAERGPFQFREGDRDSDQIPDVLYKNPLNIDPNQAMLEAARRIDELSVHQSAIGSMKDVLIKTEEANSKLEDLDEKQALLMDLLDGSRDIGRVCIDSGLGRYHTCILLADLAARRIVAPICAEDHVRLGDEEYEKEPSEMVVFHYRKALELNRHDFETRRKLSELLIEMGENEDAVDELKMLADEYQEKGEDLEAVVSYRTAAALAPRDLAVREKLLDLLEEGPQPEQAVEAGVDLAQLLTELGLNEKAQEVYHRVLRRNPDDPLPIERALAVNYVNMGDVPHAVEVYRKAADHLLEEGKVDEIVPLLEEIIQIAPDDEGAKKKLDDIHSGRLERRKRFWRIARRSAICFSLFALLLAWIIYNSVARGDLSEVVSQTYVDLEEGNVDDALERLETFRGSYPYSLASRDAREWAEQLRGIRDKP